MLKLKHKRLNIFIVNVLVPNFDGNLFHLRFLRIVNYQENSQHFFVETTRRKIQGYLKTCPISIQMSFY